MTGTYAGQFVMEVRDRDAGPCPKGGAESREITGEPWAGGFYGSTLHPGVFGIAHHSCRELMGGSLLAPASLFPRRWDGDSAHPLHPVGASRNVSLIN